MENKKYISCKNYDCPNNNKYKQKDNKGGECKIFTEKHLMNHKTCEEREF